MSFINKELKIVENVENVEKDEEVSYHLPQHPVLQWSGPEPKSKHDHLEDYKEVKPFEQSEGFLDNFRSKGTMRKKYKKLCETLNEKVPDNIDQMTKKDILAAIKALKAKHPKTSGSSDMWKFFADVATAVSS